MTCFVVGHGQLGRATTAHLPQGSCSIAQIPWTRLDEARIELERQLRRFLGRSDASSLVWTAGVSTVRSPREALAEEQKTLRRALDVVGDAGRPIKLFVASSAGGVYGGNGGLCDERTTPIPMNDYGRSKLAVEAMVAEWARHADAEVLVGRISNLYGPRQDLTKPQGFVSHVLRSMVQGSPLIFTVPAATVRDFVFADDVGRRIAHWVERPPVGPRFDVKVLAAERSVSLGHVVATAERVTRRRARVLFAGSPDRRQPASLRFRSCAAVPGIGPVPLTSIEHGIWLTWSALLSGWTVRR